MRSVERRRCPVDPVAGGPRHAIELVVRRPLRRGHALSEQELVEERVQRRGQSRWPGAVGMATDLLEAVVIRDTKRLEDGMCRSHATEAAERAEPHVVGVFVGDERARCNERREEMMVVGEGVELIDVVVEVRREPHVLGHDLRRRLDCRSAVLLEERQAPASVAARARLLRDGQGNTGLKGTRHERALAVARASCDGNLLSVDVRSRRLLQSIDDPAHSPHPRRHRASRVRAAEEVVEETLASTSGVGLLRHVRVRVAQGRDLWRAVRPDKTEDTTKLLTPAGTGMLPPSYAMTRGHPPAGAVPDGKVICGEKVMDFPLTEAVIARVPLLPLCEKVAVKEVGGPGSCPAS